MKALRVCLLALGLVAPLAMWSQTTAFDQNITFNTVNQNMWGPSFSPINLNQTITLFDVPWNTGFNTGSSGIFTVAGQSFGGSLDANFSGVIGSEIRIEGFTSGNVDVNYPIVVELDYSANNTYDPGDDVVIETDYSVRPGYEIEANYPSAGEFFWDIYFRFAAEANAQLCFFGCTTFPIIPAFDTGVQTLNIATISSSGASTGGTIGAWFLGPGQLPPYVGGLEPGIGIWPYALPPETSPTTSPVPNFIPWQCYIGPGFPADLPGALGLSGSITIPFVPDVSETLTGTDISSCNDSTYLNINLEIFQLLGGVLSNVPGPVGVVGNVLANLSGSQSVGIAEVTWNFFSASFDANITNNQCLDFTPTVNGQFEFPVAVEYTVTDPVTTATVSSGNSSIINCELGHNITYKFPCYFDTIEVAQEYTIDGQFRNHTYDEVTFDFLMSALAFSFEVPEVVIIPEITVPEICLPVPYPCPTWSNPFRWCTSTVCTPSFTIPAIGFDGWSLSVGPVWSESIPLGGFSYDWFDQTWQLEGFSARTGTPFIMTPFDLRIANTQVNNLCNGDSLGSIDVTITADSDATPYVYNWTNGATTLDITNLAAGNYNLSVIDANGCQLFTGATITEPNQLNVSATATDVTCSGANDGTVSVLAEGGTGAYTYDIGSGPQASNTFTGITPGAYTVTVTDANGCTETATFSVTEPNILVQSAVVTPVNCNGGNDGAIDATVGGGTLPYTYSWSNGASTEDLDNLTAGIYTLNVEDGRGCLSSASYAVLEPAAPLALSATFVDVACNSGSDGSIDVTTTGGTAGYTYIWSSAQQGVLPFTSEDLTNISAGTYTVIATDQNGCSQQLTQIIDEPSAPLSSSPILTDILCFGNATGVIDPVIAGGTPAYVYNWSNGSTAPIATGLTAGTYTLDVTDNNGCTDQYSYTLEEPAAALTVTLTETDVLCFGNATGAVDALVEGGTTPYTFVWNNGATTEDITGLVAGSYDVLVTDNNACTATAAVVVDQPLAPLALSSTVVDVNCFGDNSGSIDLSVTGGTPGYEYDWSNGGFIVLSDTSEDLTNQFADDYTVIVTDANGCQETLTSTIQEPAAPLTLSGVVDDVNCFGISDGAVDVSISGGTLPYIFNWSNGATSEDLNGVPAGTYTLTITDGNGCTIAETFDVTEPAAPLNIDLFATAVLCNGDNTGAIEADVSGGTAPYTYAWSSGETTEDIDNITAGTYTLTVTDAQGCIAFTGATVQEPTALVVTPNVTDASCFGYSDGVIQIDVTGGVQPYYFSWGNQNDILLNNPSETISGLPASDYFVRVRDKNGCINEQLITVGEPAPFVATSVVTDALCFGSLDGSIDMTLTGGTVPYTYVWSDGQTIEDPVNLSSGYYEYEITDDQGCILNDSVFVGQPDDIQISYQIDPVSCIDQSDASIDVTTFGGTEPYSFFWTTGSTDEDETGLPPGMYELTITDDNLCTQTFTFEIQINPDECLDIPNTFTPNNDNYNDTWVIGNIDLYPNATVKVFNEWGNEIYTSVGEYLPWDGTHRGKPLPAGVYYYIIVLGNEEDNKYTGTISIVR